MCWYYTDLLPQAGLRELSPPIALERRGITMAQADVQKPGRASAPLNEMVWLPGGTFRMGSDRHYPEEAPSHRVTVDGFWIDKTPVTNRPFKQFVKATGHVTVAEVLPDPKDYLGARPEMIYAGSLVFCPPARLVNLPRLEPVVDVHEGCRLAASLWT